jgi:hypothetical protein
MDDSTDLVIGFSGDEQQQLQYRLMLVCAMLGSVRRQTADAEAVFGSIEDRVLDKPSFMMIRAVALALGGGQQVAIDVINQRLAVDPDDDLSKVALGVAMLLNNDPDWRFTIDNVLATSMDQPARQAALKTMTYVPAMLYRGGSMQATLRPS